VHFLDNVIEANRYPLEAVEKMVKGNRKIGLGVMGFADMLVQLGIPYFSEEALKIAAEVMHFIALEARMASLDLAVRRGTFPNYPQSIWAKKNLPLRNATLLSIAPTGSISIIASCSSSIEPFFALAFRRYVLEHTELVEVHPLLEEMFQRFGVPEGIRKAVLERGTMAGIEGIPEALHRLFLTALEIPPEFHVRVQATFQKYVDNAVSKTVNLPESATPQDVFRVYLFGPLSLDAKASPCTVTRVAHSKCCILGFRRHCAKSAEEVPGNVPCPLFPAPSPGGPGKLLCPFLKNVEIPQDLLQNAGSFFRGVSPRDEGFPKEQSLS